MREKQRPYRRSTRLYLLGTLTALELLMSFSFLGYLHMEPISVTFSFLPVLLAALVGVPEAAAVGTVFGLASLWKASAAYVQPFDQLFSPMLSGRPLASICLSVGSRALFGLLAGLIFCAARRLPWQGLWIGAAAFLGKDLHALLVYTALSLFFPETGYVPADAFRDFFAPGDLAGNLIIAALVLLVWRAERSRAWQRFRMRAEQVQRQRLGDRYHRLSLAVILVGTVSLSTAVALYFVNRMDYVLRQQGLALTEVGYADLLHLQIQFLIGILAIMALVIIFLIFNRRYTTYMSDEARTDPVTGVLTRKAFFESGAAMLRDGDGSGYFLMVDLDHFKRINDRYGHPEGDQSLKNVARALREVFGETGLVGRVGGDEFAVLTGAPADRERLEADLGFFLRQVRSLGVGEDRLSCSAGAAAVRPGMTVEELYAEADRLLYRAKQEGRDRYALEAPEEKPALGK